MKKEILKNIIDKFCKSNVDKCSKKIYDFYKKKGYTRIIFVYFSQLVSANLFKNSYDIFYTEKSSLAKLYATKTGLTEFKTFDYINIILNTDFLLPDGIGVKLLGKKFGYNLPNLNGTDFIPYFLDKYKSEVVLFLYGAEETVVKKLRNKLVLEGYEVEYYQNGYGELYFETVEKKINKVLKDGKIPVMLIARSNIDFPIQELWIKKYTDWIKNNKIMVFAVGGLFNFLVGEDKRAPKFIRKFKLERLWRQLVALKDKNKFKIQLKKNLYNFQIFKVLFLKVKKEKNNENL